MIDQWGTSDVREFERRGDWAVHRRKPFFEYWVSHEWMIRNRCGPI
jgi:hypothetical protein